MPKDFSWSSLTRRRLLVGGAAAGASLPALHGLVPHAGVHEALGADEAVSHGGASHGGGHAGPTFRTGQTVDHAANGFHPTEILRDFDHGTTRRSPTGQVIREWTVVAQDKEIEVAPGVTYPAWTYNGRIPGPTLRCREGELLRVEFVNASAHPHTMHFHGFHSPLMDGVPGIGAGVVGPGERTVYEFEAEPFGCHLYHCHVTPLAEHIARGLYGAFIIDPPEGRPQADEMVMVMNGFNTTFDAEGNQLYAVNTIPFHYMDEPIAVKVGDLVRIYLVNALEYDPINSFHVHGNFFQHFPTGTSLQPVELTDTIVQGQAQRAVLEMRFKHEGLFMFHAHKTEFAELGWMGFFEASR